MKQYLYRPSDKNHKLAIRMYRLGIRESRNFKQRGAWYPVGWGLNQQTLVRIHSRLHYFAWHAPKPLQKKWLSAYEVFCKKHFGTHHASVRYLNKYSCHEWM